MLVIRSEFWPQSVSDSPLHASGGRLLRPLYVVREDLRSPQHIMYFVHVLKCIEMVVQTLLLLLL